MLYNYVKYYHLDETKRLCSAFGAKKERKTFTACWYCGIPFLLALEAR